MLSASENHIGKLLDDGAVVLDVGGWAKPYERADWVIDLMPYESRGAFGESDPTRERFSADTWVQRDICDRDPFPFADDAIDFCICSHTLEDIRDPVWVCAEIVRVAKAGYIEVPSRLEEQSFGVNGPWVGWSHHRWLIDVSETGIEFVAKPGVLQGREELRFPAGFADSLSDEDRVQTLFWEGSFEFGERVFYEAAELDGYLAEFVAAHAPSRKRRSSKGSDPGRRLFRR
jgi:hypothetical protein